MNKITELRKQIKQLDKQIDKLQNQRTDLHFEIRKLVEAEERAKVEKKFHVGDVFLQNDGITNYHCTIMKLYEVLEVELGRWPSVKVREYAIGYSDGELYTHISKFVIRDYNVGKKITHKEFEELKEIIYNPEQYEGSKWEVKSK